LIFQVSVNELSYETGRRRSRQFWKPSSELLGLAGMKAARGKKPNRQILQGGEQIKRLTDAQPAILLKTIDAFIKAASK
jgi:hypothetical protein